jgi:hypothetical protein
VSDIKRDFPAFPTNPNWFDPKTVAESERLAGGMLLRDYFAARLMVAVWNEHQPLNDFDCARRAYEMADAMLRARGAE